MKIRFDIPATAASLLMLLAIGNGVARVSGAAAEDSGTGGLEVAPSVTTDDEVNLDVSFEGVEGQAVRGVVSIDGLQVGQSGDVGELEWTRSGDTLEGTVTDPTTGEIVSTFKGTVIDDKVSGTFTSVDGNGSWRWERPLPQGATHGDPADTE